MSSSESGVLVEGGVLVGHPAQLEAMTSVSCGVGAAARAVNAVCIEDDGAGAERERNVLRWKICCVALGSGWAAEALFEVADPGVEVIDPGVDGEGCHAPSWSRR